MPNHCVRGHHYAAHQDEQRCLAKVDPKQMCDCLAYVDAASAPRVDEIYGEIGPRPEGQCESHMPDGSPKPWDMIVRSLREHPEGVSEFDLGNGRALRIKTDGLGVRLPKDGCYGLDGAGDFMPGQDEDSDG